MKCTCRTVFNLNHIPEGVNPAGCPLHDATLAEMERGMKDGERFERSADQQTLFGDREEKGGGEA
jgi:hypothetical protein